MKAIHPWLAAGALAIGGCGGKLDTDERIPLDQVPPAVLKAARDKLPDVTFDTVYRDVYNGQPVYEVRGKTKNGKIRECEVNDKGEVVNVE
jgi:hypothetical protein